MKILGGKINERSDEKVEESTETSEQRGRDRTQNRRERIKPGDQPGGKIHRINRNSRKREQREGYYPRNNTTNFPN